jgi:2-acylglycerol O-acyltransferase 2
VKAAIEEGAHIIPVFFFGNTRQFKIIGSPGENSFLSRLSRKLRTSIVFFYGRFGLPIPFRHPIKMVSGEIVEVDQCSSPTAEQVEEVMNRVIKSVTDLYNSPKKPSWETRPLVVM